MRPLYHRSSVWKTRIERLNRSVMCAFAYIFCGVCVFGAVGCQAPVEVEIPFGLAASGRSLTCESSSELAGSSITLRKARFYVYDVEFKKISGQWVSLSHHPSSWTTEGISLVDLDDERCDGGDPEMNMALTGTLPPGEYKGLRFKLGVPAERNHLDPMKAAPPLAHTSMHWGWQAGYRFMRLDTRVDGKMYNVHLGSDGCQGEVGAPGGCARPNRAVISIPDFVPGTKQYVRVNLSALLAGVDTEKLAGCMGQLSEPDCAVIYKNLGLDPERGEPVAETTVFYPVIP